jgi:hypothetical protein
MEEKHLNIILVSGATARAKTLTLDWRHFAAGTIGILILFFGFTLIFNFVTLRYAAAIKHPWLQAIVLADQRQEALKTQEMVQGHLNAMAIRVGELQAQMLRLDGLGERLAGIAGLKPQELPAMRAGRKPGQGGAESSLPSRRCRSPSSPTSWSGCHGRSMSAPISWACSKRCSCRPRQPQIPADARADHRRLVFVELRYRIDPFSGEQSFHEGVDFPPTRHADRGRRKRQGRDGRGAPSIW